MQKTRIIAGLGVVLIAMLFVVVQHSLSTGIRVVVLILGSAVLARFFTWWLRRRSKDSAGEA